MLKYLARPSGLGPGRRPPVAARTYSELFSAGVARGGVERRGPLGAAAGGRILASVGDGDSLGLGPVVMEGHTVGDGGRYPSGLLLEFNPSLACFVLPQESLYERKDTSRLPSALEMANVSKLVLVHMHCRCRMDIGDELCSYVCLQRFS